MLSYQKTLKGMTKSQLASFGDEMKTDGALEAKDFGGWKRFRRRKVTSSHNEFKIETIKSMTDRSLFFIHIPKTGGTTLRDLIEQRFEPHALCPDEYMMRRSGGGYPQIPWYLSIPEDQFGQIRLLRGPLYHHHFPGADGTDHLGNALCRPHGGQAVRGGNRSRGGGRS
jgi:hypothetical protein